MIPIKRAIIILICTTLLNLSWASSKIKLGDVPEDPTNQEPNKIKDVLKDKVAPEAADEEGSIEENYQLIRDVTEEFYQKGLKALNSNDLGTAEAYFDRVLTIKPNHVGAKKGIDAIMKAYEDTTPVNNKVDPKIALIKKLEDKLYEKLSDEDYEEAAGVANEILAIDPNNKVAKQKLTFSNRKLYAEALERAQTRAEAGDERGAIDAYQLAMGYGKDPSLKEKISALRTRMAEKTKAHSSKLYIEALTASQNGKTDAAVALCKKVLAIDPKNIQAQRMLDRLTPPAKSPEASVAQP